MTRHIHKTLAFAVVLGSTLSLLGCDDEETTPTPYDSGWNVDGTTTDTRSGDTNDSAPTDLGTAFGDSPASEASSADAEVGSVDAQDTGDAATLSQGQIATIVRTVNDGEIELAATVRPRLASSGALQYANAMEAEHTAANTRQTALFTELGITASPTDIATQLQSTVAQARTQLASLSGQALDLAYLESQAAMHSSVLTMIDTQLLPSATNSRLRDELTTTRAAVAAHAAQAQALIAQLGSDGGISDASSDSSEAGQDSASAD